MKVRNPYQSPADSPVVGGDRIPADLRRQLGRQRRAVQVMAVSFFVCAALHLLTAISSLAAIRPANNDRGSSETSFPGSDLMQDAQSAANRHVWLRCLSNLVYAGTLGSMAWLLGIYARRLVQAMTGTLGIDELIPAQALLWYPGACLGLLYILSQILQLFRLPDVIWALLRP